jgi:hypothetical protein
VVWATEIYDEDDVWDVETSCNDGCCHHYIFDALFEILESVLPVMRILTTVEKAWFILTVVEFFE